MNKKAQLSPYPEPGTNPFGGAHPILIIGIVIFVLPFFNGVLNWGIPGWLSGLGIFVILIGAGLSIMKASR
jgi:hypothetical protein